MSLAPSSSQPSFRYLYTLARSLRAFSSPGRTVLALSALHLRRDAPVPSTSGPFSGISSVSPYLSCTGDPELGPALQICLASAKQRWGRIVSLSLLATFLLMQPVVLLAFFATRAHSWFMFNLVSTLVARSFPVGTISSWSVLSMYWCMELFLPRYRTWHFLLMN